MKNEMALPLISAGASIGSNLISAFTAKSQQQRANAFNVDMWNRQNLYNSPAEQMKRLQQAGLNPNLIYGSGAGGASGTATNAPNFQELSEHGYKPVDIPSALSSMQAFTDWEIKKAQEDKLQTASDLDRARIASETLNQSGKMISNAKSAIELRYANRLQELSVDALEAGVKKTLADTKYTLNQDVRSELMNRQNIIESAQRILQSQSNIKLNSAQMQKVMTDTRVQNFFAKLADANINPNLRPEITELGSALASIIKSVMKTIDGFKMPEWPW